MVKRTVKKSTRKALRKPKSTGSASKSSKVSNKPKSSNRKTAPQVNPFAQQGYPQAAPDVQGQGMYARGGKLKKKKGCRK